MKNINHIHVCKRKEFKIANDEKEKIGYDNEKICGSGREVVGRDW